MPHHVVVLKIVSGEVSFSDHAVLANTADTISWLSLEAPHEGNFDKDVPTDRPTWRGAANHPSEPPLNVTVAKEAPLHHHFPYTVRVSDPTGVLIGKSEVIVVGP